MLHRQRVNALDPWFRRNSDRIGGSRLFASPIGYLQIARRCASRFAEKCSSSVKLLRRRPANGRRLSHPKHPTPQNVSGTGRRKCLFCSSTRGPIDWKATKPLLAGTRRRLHGTSNRCGSPKYLVCPLGGLSPGKALKILSSLDSERISQLGVICNAE